MIRYSVSNIHIGESDGSDLECPIALHIFELLGRGSDPFQMSGAIGGDSLQRKEPFHPVTKYA